MIDLTDLNPQQREAVTHEGGPLLVLAGAGSGKTRVITYRIAWLISHRNVDPSTILAVTFTNKAANEMLERVDLLTRGPGRRPLIGTFHSTSLRMLRKYADRLGFSRSFVVYDTSDHYVGCCYLYPVGRRTPLTEQMLAHDVDVSWWVTPRAYDLGYYEKLYLALRKWVTDAFPFKRPYFSNVEIPDVE